MSTHSIAKIESRLSALHVSQSDIEVIINHLRIHENDVEYWLAIAARLRPSYFDETAFHVAEIIYEAAISRFPLTERLAGNYGILLYNWGRFHEAIEWFEASLNLDPKYDNSRHNLAYCYELLEDYGNAARIYEQAIKDNPFRPESWNGLGNCLWEQGQKDKALEAYQGALNVEPTHGDALFNLAAHLVEISHFEKALDVVNRLCQLYPDDQGASYLGNCIRRKEMPRLEKSSYFSQPDASFSRVQARPDIMVWPIQQIWESTVNQSKTEPNPLWHRPPQIFISYRRESAKLENWITNFAHDLVERGYSVMYDNTFGLRDEIVGIPTVIEQLVRSSYYVPILTERFRRAVEFKVAKDKTAAPICEEDSVVLDEWLAAMNLACLNRIRLLGIWRSGPVVPAPFSSSLVADARNRDDYPTLLRRFPKLEFHGKYITFTEPTSFSERSPYVTHSPTINLIPQRLELAEALRMRSYAFQSIVSEVKMGA